MASVPSVQSPAVNQAGQFTQEWVGFFTALTAKAGAIQAITPSGSPFSFTAPSNGTLSIHDGTVSGVTLTRARMTTPVAVGALPVSAGDVVTATYTAAPIISFIPRAG